MTNGAWMRWTGLLGLALGGFFDGIVLHQILQWHHLLSLVPGMADLRLQILWDGVFHGLMYLLALLALIGLWRSRTLAAAALPTLGGLLICFALWHVLDAVLSHWLLGIHRIKVDSPNPLAWDLGWLAGFGLLPLAIGLRLIRRAGLPPVAPDRWVASLALLACGAGAWALQPAPGEPLTAVVFANWISPAAAEQALSEAQATIAFHDPDSGVAIVAVDPNRRWALYRKGALFVSGTALPEGCFSWTAT